MRKLLAAINMTVDWFCDHTAMIADAELHQHYTDLLRSASAVLYGRITCQLMESYWPSVVKNPTGNKTTDEFAVAIQDISKIVFSRTLTNVGWENSKIFDTKVNHSPLANGKHPEKPIVDVVDEQYKTHLNLSKF